MTKTSRKMRSSAGDAAKNETDQALRSARTGKEALSFKTALQVLIICVVGLLAYSNTFQSPFQWDESDYIVNNPFIKDLSYFAHPSRAMDMLNHALISRYVGFFTFALNYRIHGFDVVGYHIVNLSVHLINALLVYFLVLLTFRTPFFGDQGSGINIGTRDQSPATGRVAPNPESPVPSSGSPVPGPQSQVPGFIAFAAALLFVSHPIQTEAVTYIFQRFAALVTLFYLLSLVLYIKGRLGAGGHRQEKNGGKDPSPLASRLLPMGCFLLSFLSAVLAMKTKENAFTLPVVITLYEFLFFSGPLKSRILRLVPFFATMLIVPMTMIIIDSVYTTGEIISQTKDPAALGYQQLSRAEYLFTQFRVIVTYIRLLFLPLDQNVNYNYPVYRSFFDPAVLLSFLFLLSILGAAVYLLYRSRREAIGNGRGENSYSLPLIVYYRLIAFGILWFFITLSVESSVIPIPMVINEYRGYLPSVGFFLALLSTSVFLVQRFTGENMGSPSPSGGESCKNISPPLREGDNGEGDLISSRQLKIAAIVFGVIILVLASATYARNAVWTDKVRLWEDVVRKTPDSPRGYNNLGIAYFEKGEHQKAIAMYERCIALYPLYRTAYINLGVAYAAIGRMDAAVATFRNAVEVDPGNSIAYANLGRAYSDIGRYEEALESYFKAIELNPNHGSFFHGLGTIFVKLGRLEDALSAYSRFVALSPRDPEAYRNRGLVYAARGDFGSAASDFRASCSLGSSQSCEFLKDPRFR